MKQFFVTFWEILSGKFKDKPTTLTDERILDLHYWERKVLEAKKVTNVTLEEI